MNIPIPPGVFDLLPVDAKEKWKSCYLWEYVESVIRDVSKAYGFREIRTPLFERTELFKRGVGETSDIVSKEMYTFDDRGGRSLSLRPEGTAPVMRAFLENHLDKDRPIQKLFYIGPMFRYERAQAGRYRQHHQFGVEAIGSKAPEQDAEIILMLNDLYTRLGIQNLKVSINSLGSNECRVSYRKALQDYLQPYLKGMSEESKVRFTLNPLRILDSKDPKDREILTNAPSILEYLNKDSLLHFEKLQQLLKQENIAFEVSSGLVRGLDYYNNTVFEFVAGELGAQNSVGGGGRYDGLLKSLGGPDLPSFGFGTGIERILQTLLKQESRLPPPSRTLLYIIPLGEEAKKFAFSLARQLREKNISTEVDYSDRKLNKIMAFANQIQAEFVVVIGNDELKKQEFQLKEMSSGVSTLLNCKDLTEILLLEKKYPYLTAAMGEISKPFASEIVFNYFKDKIQRSANVIKTATADLKETFSSLYTLLD